MLHYRRREREVEEKFGEAQQVLDEALVAMATAAKRANRLADTIERREAERNGNGRKQGT